MDTKREFECDFVRLHERILAAHAFFQAEMDEQAHEWLVESQVLLRGLITLLAPCTHDWKLESGTITCAKCAS